MKKMVSLILALSVFLSLFAGITIYAQEVLLEYTFEKEDEGWLSWNSKSQEHINISDACASEGSKNSMFIHDTSTKASAGIKSPKIPVKAGETYTALCDNYRVSGSIKLTIRFYNEAGAQLSSDGMASGSIGKWVNLANVRKAPEGATHAEILLVTNVADEAKGFFDNVKFVKGEVVAKTITGTTPSPESLITEEVLVEKIDEVLVDCTFEKEGEGWEPWTAATAHYINVSSDVASGGSKNSMYIHDSSETDSTGMKFKRFKVNPGETYTVACDFYLVSGAVSLYLRFYDASGAQLSSDSAKGKEGKWVNQVVTKVAPSGAAMAEVLFATNKATEGYAYIDNVKFVKGVVFEKDIVGTTFDPDYLEPKQSASVDAKIVAPVNNKLEYSTYNAEGDKLSDYSNSGFANGLYELPESKNIPVVATLSPSGTADDTKMIQDAIDKAASEAEDDGFKMIKLKAGKYNINKSGISLKTGIVLSGEGQGPTGTILYSYEPVKHNTINITGLLPRQVGDRYDIIDDYVKSGSNKINLSEEDVKNFKVGDLIVIYHPSTEEWVKAMKMTEMVSSSGGDNSWTEGAVDVQTERVITAINGTEITLDFSLFVPLEKKYAQSYVYKLDESQRVVNAGVENLRLESYYNGDSQDENHGNNAISITYAKNCFVRDISAKYYILSAVACGRGTKQITVQNCSSLQPVSQIAGGRRYAFSASTIAQQILYTGCYSYDSRHDYVANYSLSGPVVFLDSIMDKSNSSNETHGVWSNGVLYDNLYEVPHDSGGYICMANRGIFGTSASQGWTSAGGVVWNSLSYATIVHKPPLTYQNFSVGAWGVYNNEASEVKKESAMRQYKKNYRSTDFYEPTEQHFVTEVGNPFVGDAYREAECIPVNPRSLYKAQLSERITGTINNARPNAPVIVYPRADKETYNGNVTVSGVYQLGATQVNIYIDDVMYKAELDSSNNSFTLTKELLDGVHKIYATQVIDGFESTKTADRFITIGKANGNPEYLQSIYDSSKTRLLVNDPRETYDVYYTRYLKENADKIKVLVNQKNLESDVEPFETNGRVLVPMRAIFEALSASVAWDEATATATANLFDTTVKITENQTTAYVNGNPVTLDVPATIVNGRFVVPVRFISESFGAKVDWIDAKKTVTVDGGIKFPAVHGLEGQLDVCAAIQSGDDGAGAVIENVFDDDYSTKWGVACDDANPQAAYGIFDLGYVTDIGSIHIAFTFGDVRVYTFDIYVSSDNVNYTPVKTGIKSGGKTTKFEEFPLNTNGRYIKIVGHANSVNKWMNMQEVAFTRSK